jgi:hypothetical protein
MGIWNETLPKITHIYSRGENYKTFLHTAALLHSPREKENH